MNIVTLNITLKLFIQVMCASNLATIYFFFITNINLTKNPLKNRVNINSEDVLKCLYSCRIRHVMYAQNFPGNPIFLYRSNRLFLEMFLSWFCFKSLTHLENEPTKSFLIYPTNVGCKFINSTPFGSRRFCDSTRHCESYGLGTSLVRYCHMQHKTLYKFFINQPRRVISTLPHIFPNEYLHD